MSRNEPVDTLRLSPTARDAIIESLDRLSRDSRGVENVRRHDRVAFAASRITVVFVHPGGVETRCLVTARNLSAGGLGFLHGGFLHQGTACLVALPTIYGDTQAVRGTVRSCRHVAGNVHEIGVEFAAPVDPCEFIEPCDAPLRDTEDSLDASALAGDALAIEACPADARLLAHHLGGSSVRLETRPDFESARELIGSVGFDVILLGDGALRGNGGADTVQAIRMEGCDAPLIALTAESDAKWLASVRRCGFAEILIKPYTPAKLFGCLERRLPAGASGASAGGRIHSEIASADTAGLLEVFLVEAQASVRQIAAAIDAGDRAAARAVCLGLKGNGRGYGFPRLSDAAREMIEALDGVEPSAGVDLALKRLDLLVQRLTAAVPASSDDSAEAGKAAADVEPVSDDG